MSNKLFTVAGTSNLNGANKFRFSTSMNRVAILQKNGHTDINLVELPSPMSKEDAIQYLTAQGIGAAKPSVKSVLAEKVEKVAVKAA
jgi:hypothetical protein